MAVIREQPDAYVKEKYGIDPEILPFSKEDYGVYRHQDTGRWFAVFIVKDRSAFGLPGSGKAELVCFKIRDSIRNVSPACFRRESGNSYHICGTTD